jgi:membrane associated rhomboid family serine protease
MIPLRDDAPAGATPWVNWALMLSCILVFLWQLAYPGGFEQSLLTWGEVPSRILGGENVPGTGISAWWTLLSAMFMHGGFLHLAGNMVSLWIFGDNIEWLLGRARYLAFYLACGVAASLATLYLGSASDMPGIGASGAIAGVMAAYMLMYPQARVTTLVLGRGGSGVYQISALWFIGAWIAIQVLQSVQALGQGVNMNLGIYAHVAGAIAGAILVWPLLIPGRRSGGAAAAAA